MSLQPDSVALGMGVTSPPSGTFMAIQKADDEVFTPPSVPRVRLKLILLRLS